MSTSSKGSGKPGGKPAADRKQAMRAIQKSGGKTVQSRGPSWVRVGAPIGAVLVVIALLVGVKLSQKSSPSKPAQSAVPASAEVISKLTGVTAATFDAVGIGSVKSAPQKLSGAPLTADGKPRVLYIGAEYCPYCAAERWAVIAALSRFGTWANLGETTSASDDVFPSTPTLTFHGASFSSNVVSFTGVETQTNERQGNGYAPLDTVAAADQAVFSQINPRGSIPFLDIAGLYANVGASFDPGVLKGKTHAEIAAAMQDPSSVIAKAIDGTANVITAAICQSTNNAPSTVCNSAGVTAGRAKLNAS